MVINFKLLFLNYALMLCLIPFLTMIQNSIWPSIFTNSIPIYLWIPFIIYWAIYRKPGETIFIIYITTLSVASTSSLFAGYLLILHALILLTIYLFKRVYYTNWMFFSTACAVTLFLIPIILWVLSQINNSLVYFSGTINWLLGGFITWVLSFVILFILKKIDSITLFTQNKTGYNKL